MASDQDMQPLHDRDVDERSRITLKKTFSHEYNERTCVSEDLSWFQKFPKRYILCILAFLGFCNVYALRVNLSVAIVAMVKNRTEIYNGTLVEMVDFDWDRVTQGFVLGSFFYGYILTQIPGGWLATKVGGKHLFGVGVFMVSLLTLITPPAARVSYRLLIAVRVAEGLFEGVTYPSMHAIWANWAPPLERSKLVMAAFSGAYFGTVVAMPLSGIIADTIGWPWIFYLFGFLGIIWFIIWSLAVTETPSKHQSITHLELEYIQHSIGYRSEQIRGARTPWCALMSSLPMWAIVIAHFSANWGFYTLLTELPTYLNDIIKFDMYKAGMLAALPYLAMAIIVLNAGYLVDCLRSKSYLSTTNARKIFTSGAFLFQMAFILITAYAMSPGAAVACITMAVGFGGFSWAGFSVNHLDIAPQYASIMMGISNTFATIPGIVSPTLTGILVQHKSVLEWRIVFFISAGVYLVGAIFYAIFASGERQPWAEVRTGYEPHIDDEERERD